MDNVNVRVFWENLTEKQLDVLSCLVFGLSYKSIGRTLCISNRTVEGHVHEIVQKAKVSVKDEIIKCLHLPENANYLNELKKRYNCLVSGIKLQKKRIISWKIYIVVTSIVLLAGIITAYFSNRAEISLQSVRGSVYILKRKKLIDRMNCKNRVIILEGQGGAGKTTLAREYLKESRLSLKYEINAETKGSVKSELSGLAMALAKTSKDMETKSIIESISDGKEQLRHLSIFLYNKLREEKAWCLLLDNLDNPSIISLIYLDNLLRLNNGKIIITTRNKNIRSYFPDANVVCVGKLSEKEKIELFYKIAKQVPSDIIKENLLEIPSYPLDISCCAHYVKNTGISLPEYVQKMQKIDKDFWSGNQKILMDNANYNESRYSIISSSVDNILHQNGGFMKALFAISVLDSQKISPKLLSKIVGEQASHKDVYNFQRYGLVEMGNDGCFSMHRVTQTIMRHYCFRYLPKETLDRFVSEICDVVCEDKYHAYMIVHLKAILSNLKDKMSPQDKIKIQIALIHLIQHYGRVPVEATKYIREVVKNGKSFLDQYKMIELQLEGARLCISAGKNEEAVEFLKNDLEKLPFNQKHIYTYINYYTLWGILHMRVRHPNEANANFDRAIKLLGRVKENSDKRRVVEASIYSAKGINHILCFIYKPKTFEVINLMKYAINLIEGIDTPEANIVRANTKIRLATLYNSSGMHDEVIKVCEESEHLLEKIKTKNNDYYFAKGMMYLDRGLALLRKNNPKESKHYLHAAKELFDQVMIYDYFSRVRIQEAEALVRLKEYDEAYRDCMEVINGGRTDNDFYEMFLNRAHYTAGVIQYKLGHYQQALKHFRDFSVGMKKFCRHFLNKQKYAELENMHAFDIVTDEQNIKICLANALEILKKVCYEGSRFITEYVQKNLDDA